MSQQSLTLQPHDFLHTLETQDTGVYPSLKSYSLSTGAVQSEFDCQELTARAACRLPLQVIAGTFFLPGEGALWDLLPEISGTLPRSVEGQLHSCQAVFSHHKPPGLFLWDLYL